jgi:hypothetical protein
MTHTTGPQVAANDTMKVVRQTSVMIAAGSPGEFGSASTASEPPSTPRLSTIPIRPPSSIGLRPTRSMIRIATTVMTTLRTPITMLA